jgi:tetratricopeptide (TPR) repeat protein
MKAVIALAAVMVAAAASGCATNGPASSVPSPDGASAASPGVPSPVPQAAAPPPRPPSQDRSQQSARAPSRGFGLPAEPDGPLPELELSPQLLFQLLAADLAAQRGEAGSAWSTYMSAARQTRDPRIARRAAEVAIAARALDEAVQSTQLWREIAPDSRAATQTLETLWLSTGRLADAEPMLTERLAQARRDGTLPAAYTQLQRSLQRSQDRAGTWQLIQRLSAPDLQVPAARLARAAFAAAADDVPAAAAEAREAMRLAPDDEDAVIAAARNTFRLPDGRQPAIDILEAFVQRSPMSIEARFAYARLLLADGRTGPARDQLERTLAQSPNSPAVLFSLAQVAHQGKQPAEAQKYLERYVELPRSVPRDNAPALLFLAQIAEEGGRLDEAIDWLAKVPRGDELVPATVRRALLMGKSGKVEAGRELLQSTTPGSVRERAQLISAESQLLREARRNQDAFDVLALGLERMPDNPDLLYDHAMAAERIDRLPVMEASLRRLIELRPDHAHAYNALGYTFADRNIRLDEARTLLEKALSLSPDDAHIMDSMGWVLFRQKEYPRALEYLRKAYSLRPEAEIAAHLGEVLWATGNTDEARRLWLEARGREPDNSTLRETLARLNVAL